MIDRRTALIGSLAAAGMASSTRVMGQTAPPHNVGDRVPAWPQPVETIDLWPGGAPGMPDNMPAESVVERSTDGAINDRAVDNIAVPRMAVFKPWRPNGASMLIMPGGGYVHVVIDREGYEMAQWLAERGFTCFVLFYRLPDQGWAAGPDVALSDAQRAIRLIRQRAGDYALDPARVCAMGFSAGGHLCADLAARFDAATYDGVDGADKLSARPLIAAPLYPVMTMQRPWAHEGSRTALIGKDAGPALEAAHSPDRNVKENTPPCFLCHAEDDPSVPVENTLLFRAALKAKGVPVETHLFEYGGHGFAMRRVIGKPAGRWPELLLNWARTHEVLI
ncbi:alpha/beta hydrolase [Stakelama sp. CBK3Z-3]|uniref:Alpha/beta hydrolase n=1 Tax=Stakelama flava TaxID=2860338 RepID=A0ABS6XQD2_9SPHN|nr:alpha/beta hydrolase [Stakelama flava]MBW4331620.1 alpha/beta hydrolase [Stakelama flava]